MHNTSHPFNERKGHRGVKSFLLLPFPTHAIVDPWIESGLYFKNYEIIIILELKRLKQSPKPLTVDEIIHQNFEFYNCSIKLLVSKHPSQI
jgi:hypothetical protein